MPGLGPRIAVVVTAAGSSERFGGGKKELLTLEGRSILDRALSPFLDLPALEALVVTAPAGREAEFRAALSPDSLKALGRLGPKRFAIVAGGRSRRDSVRLGLEALVQALGSIDSVEVLDDIIVLVHDGARPWASTSLAVGVAESAALRGASVPILPLVDTPKEIDSDGTVLRHPPRSSLGGAQTPQGFRLGSLLAAHRRTLIEDREGILDFTDDAELWDRYVGPVASVPGEAENRKITFARDLPDASAGDSARDFRVGQGQNEGAEDAAFRVGQGQNEDAEDAAFRVGQGQNEDAEDAAFRVGQGWDIHRLVPGRALMLGGVEVPSELGEDAHSDGDVLLHAVADALFGAAALGDIGMHFPPSDERWRGADSRDLVRRAVALVSGAGWRIGNLDCTVVLERPRLGPYKDAIRESVAGCLGISPNAVSIKAKTKEGLDAVGEVRAVEAFAIVTLFPIS
ncbi:MAG: 2-C-methyl-D-erythritol 2,4-cyclodiphosphate synthase [Rectinemataceae bacterium]|jgi:2-C-methyl-D-erythritol 4-phosphate cytidylyltransferase/2-C-methyl-D-erythritol 2,4-cyclodiphosphate synthase